MPTVVVYQPGRYAVARFGVAGGPPGPPGDFTYGAVSGSYTRTNNPGSFSDDLGGGGVGTTGAVVIRSRDNTDTAFPLAAYFAGTEPGGLLQVWWAGGRRVYERRAGDATIDVDVTYGNAYEVPVTLRYSTAVLPAAGTALRLTALPAPKDDVPARRFAVVLASPTTRQVMWASGPITLGSLTYCAVDFGAGAGTLTVTLNSVPVAGWVALTVDTGDPVTVAPSSPVTLADGDLLTLTWTGDGDGLSLGFSE